MGCPSLGRASVTIPEGRCVTKPNQSRFRRGLKLGSDAATIPASTSTCDHIGTMDHLQPLSATSQDVPLGLPDVITSHKRIALAMSGMMPTQNMITRATTASSQHTLERYPWHWDIHRCFVLICSCLSSGIGKTNSIMSVKTLIDACVALKSAANMQPFGSFSTSQDLDIGLHANTST